MPSLLTFKVCVSKHTFAESSAQAGVPHGYVVTAARRHSSTLMLLKWRARRKLHAGSCGQKHHDMHFENTNQRHHLCLPCATIVSPLREKEDSIDTGLESCCKLLQCGHHTWVSGTESRVQLTMLAPECCILTCRLLLKPFCGFQGF